MGLPDWAEQWGGLSQASVHMDNDHVSEVSAGQQNDEEVILTALEQLRSS